MSEREQALAILDELAKELAPPPSYTGAAPDLRVLALREAMRRIMAAPPAEGQRPETREAPPL